MIFLGRYVFRLVFITLQGDYHMSDTKEQEPVIYHEREMEAEHDVYQRLSQLEGYERACRLEIEVATAKFLQTASDEGCAKLKQALFHIIKRNP